MLKRKDFSTILFDDNSSFSDLSLNLLSYSEKTETIPFVALEDKLYFGRYKPFSFFYIEMGTVNTNASTMTVEYYDETSADWVAVSQQIDETHGLTQSGFVHWANSNTDSGDPWIANTVNSTSKFWVRISFSNDLSLTTAIKGWNIVFSDDDDLENIHPGILNYLRSSQSSFISHHENARDQIVLDLRRDGILKYQIGDNVNNDGFPEDPEAWDVLLPDQVNRWSTMLALHSIFKQIATQPDDQFNEMSRHYYSKAQEAKEVYYLAFDQDDDGHRDIEERTLTFKSGVLRRV